MIPVYVPFTGLEEQTIASLERTGHPYETVFVGGYDGAYWELLNDLWCAGDSFIIVEHDIVVMPHTLTELEACPESWCSFGSPYIGGNVYHGLGCVKFGAALIARHPGALDRVALRSDAQHPPKHWCRLDAWLQGHELNGERRHFHDTVLPHIKRVLRPSHGCMEG